MQAITFDEILRNFILLFAVIDPLGTVPVFIKYTKQHPKSSGKSIAVRACCYAFLILAFFLVAGQFLFEAMGIPLAAFQVSGGIILFLFALTMIFGDAKRDTQESQSEHQTALFPIAMPAIASPGAIVAVMLLTDNHRFSIAHQTVTFISVAVIVILTAFLLISVQRIHRIIGDSGAALLSRIMGLILASIAANFALQGMLAYFD